MCEICAPGYAQNVWIALSRKRVFCSSFVQLYIRFFSTYGTQVVVVAVVVVVGGGGGGDSLFCFCF